MEQLLNDGANTFLSGWITTDSRLEYIETGTIFGIGTAASSSSVISRTGCQLDVATVSVTGTLATAWLHVLFWKLATALLNAVYWTFERDFQLWNHLQKQVCF